MVRRGPSEADRYLLNAAQAAGVRVSLAQLERWRTAGLIPRNVRRGLGRGRGSVSTVPEDALPRLMAVARTARQGRALPINGVFARVIHGVAISDMVVRAEVERHLRRCARAMALDIAGDRGWQERADRARRQAGSGPPLGLDELMSADLGGEVSTTGMERGWREALGTLAHVYAGDEDGVSSEDLARALVITRPGVTVEELEQVAAEMRDQEILGADLVTAMVPLISIRRMIEDAAVVDIAILKRAIAATWMVRTWHIMLMMMALHDFARAASGSTKLDELLPEFLRSVPADVERLRGHPAWSWFSQATVTTSRWLPAEVCMTAMMLVRDPLMLAAVENYRDLLTAVMQEHRIDQTCIAQHGRGEEQLSTTDSADGCGRGVVTAG